MYRLSVSQRDNAQFTRRIVFRPPDLAPETEPTDGLHRAAEKSGDDFGAAFRIDIGVIPQKPILKASADTLQYCCPSSRGRP